MNLPNRIRKELNQRRANGLHRSLSVKPGLVDLCSNDYLGFSAAGVLEGHLSPSPHRGSTGSRLLSGNTPLAEETERKTAEAFHAEAALIFGGGYDANLGLFSALGSRSSVVFYDELIHASARDGIRLGHSRSVKFRHNDLDDLALKLERTEGEKIVAVESLYSMDGDIAPLKELAAICDEHHASLIVDEAHATGVFGTAGAGLVVAEGLEARVFARIHTFGKALGAHGGAVLGSIELRDYLVNFSRPFIYATAPSNHFFEAVQGALAALSASEGARHALWERIEQFEAFTSASGFASRIRPNHSPIQSIPVPGNAEARRASRALEEAGFDVRPILSPTVAAGTERLRISLHAHNTDTEIVKLVTVLESILGHEPKAVNG